MEYKMMQELYNWLENSSINFQVYLFFGLLIFLSIIEFIFPKRNNNINKNKRWFSNYILTTINIIILSFIPISFISLAYLAKLNLWGAINQIEFTLWVIFPATIFLRGFISFITHFLTHKIPYLWKLHRVHHLDTELDVSTTVRFHPLEFVINLIIGGPIVILLGLDPVSLLFYELLDVVVTLFSHANVSLPVNIEKYLRYLIVTPDLHRIHHSSWQPETDSNFSAVFPVWDLIFGTFKTRTKKDQSIMELGLEEVRDNRTTNVGWLLISPIKNLRKK